jgi:hypothetical protein
VSAQSLLARVMCDWEAGLVPGIGISKGGTDSEPRDALPRLRPADVFVGIICGRTGHRRSLKANGFG